MAFADGANKTAHIFPGAPITRRRERPWPLTVSPIASHGFKALAKRKTASRPVPAPA
jgi:hypothetical protein